MGEANLSWRSKTAFGFAVKGWSWLGILGFWIEDLGLGHLTFWGWNFESLSASASRAMTISAR